MELNINILTLYWDWQGLLKKKKKTYWQSNHSLNGKQILGLTEI